MQMTQVATAIVWTISLASILCMLARPGRIAEAYWSCGGGMLLVLSRLISVRQAAHAVYEGMDVYLFLIGMMILAELAREGGVFDWVADAAALHANNSPVRLFGLIYVMGIVVTALLSNDATAVVLTPAVFAVVRKAEVDPKPYLLACAFIANAAGFIFPISNPANLVFFGGSMPSLGGWLRIFLLPSAASVLVTFLCLRWILRKQLGGAMRSAPSRKPLSTEGELALWGLGLAVVGLVTSSALGFSLGPPTCAAAFLATAVVAGRSRGVPGKIVRGVSWSVLPLVAGLFVIVAALQNAGALHLGLAGLEALGGTRPWIAKGIASFAVAALSNGMNNLPAGRLAGAVVHVARETGVVMHGMLMGVDLGPNLSVTGSLATILWLIALRREKVEISAWEFFRVGIIAMPSALLAGLLLLWK